MHQIGKMCGILFNVQARTMSAYVSIRFKPQEASGQTQPLNRVASSRYPRKRQVIDFHVKSLGDFLTIKKVYFPSILLPRQADTVLSSYSLSKDTRQASRGLQISYQRTGSVRNPGVQNSFVLVLRQTWRPASCFLECSRNKLTLYLNLQTSSRLVTRTSLANP